RSAQGEWERFPEEPTSHPAVARADRSEDTDRGSAVRESPCLSGMNPERHEHPKESGDPVRHDTHGARRLGDGGRQVVPGRTADSGPKDEIRNPLVRRRIARDIRPREVRAAHVHTRAESPEEGKTRGSPRTVPRLKISGLTIWTPGCRVRFSVRLSLIE